MSGKLNLRQRAISDYEFAKSSKKKQFSLQLHEGRLSTNVAKLGQMYPFVKIFFANEVWKSDSSHQGGLHPKWNQFNQFASSTQKTLELVVFDKSFFFGETEIGRCTIHLNDVVQGHLTEWWDIMNLSGEISGAVLLTFEFPSPEPGFQHSSNNSWDFKMHHHVESSPIVSRITSKHQKTLTHRTPDVKIMHCNTEPDDGYDLEQLRNELIEENLRLKNQEITVKKVFSKLKDESIILKVEKIELKKANEALQSREETILQEKKEIINEKLGIDKEKEEIQKMKESLNLEYFKLKQEKLKIKAHKRLQEQNILKTMEKTLKLDKQKEILQRLNVA